MIWVDGHLFSNSKIHLHAIGENDLWFRTLSRNFYRLRQHSQSDATLQGTSHSEVWVIWVDKSLFFHISRFIICNLWRWPLMNFDHIGTCAAWTLLTGKITLPYDANQVVKPHLSATSWAESITAVISSCTNKYFRRVLKPHSFVVLRRMIFKWYNVKCECYYLGGRSTHFDALYVFPSSLKNCNCVCDLLWAFLDVTCESNSPSHNQKIQSLKFCRLYLISRLPLTYTIYNKECV